MDDYDLIAEEYRKRYFETLRKFEEKELTRHEAIRSLFVQLREIDDLLTPVSYPLGDDHIEMRRISNIQAAFLDRLKNQIQESLNMFEESGKETSNDTMERIVWNRPKADLARIYKSLVHHEIISISSRDFSKHFSDRHGKPISMDFVENLTSKQNELSKNQGVLEVQKNIESMKTSDR